MPRYFSLSTSCYFREYCLKEKLFIQREMLYYSINIILRSWNGMPWNNDIKEEKYCLIDGHNNNKQDQTYYMECNENWLAVIFNWVELEVISKQRLLFPSWTCIKICMQITEKDTLNNASAVARWFRRGDFFPAATCPLYPKVSAK